MDKIMATVHWLWFNTLNFGFDLHEKYSLIYNSITLLSGNSLKIYY